MHLSCKILYHIFIEVPIILLPLENLYIIEKDEPYHLIKFTLARG